jgi:cytochrome P450
LSLVLGARWKRVRATLTPTFSSAKMKKMSCIMSKAVDILINVVGNHEKAGTEANFYDLYQGLTLDVIGNVQRQSISRHWKDHFKNDLRSDQDHRFK